MACPPKIGPPLMRDSCKIRTGGSISENKKVDKWEGKGARRGAIEAQRREAQGKKAQGGAL